jgi:hypothetical protein
MPSGMPFHLTRDNEMEFESKVWRVSQEMLKYYRQSGTVYVSGQLRVTVEVGNLDRGGEVGMRYTEDDWKSFQESVGSWSRHNDTADTNQFLILSKSTIAPGTMIKYAVYQKLHGITHWDNNHSRNYCARF